MYLAATYINLGPTTLVTIAVALIAAVASIVAAVVAARSAGSSKRLEVQAQRIRDLESRISERKYKMYEPFLEMINNFFDHTEKGREAIADPKVNVEGFVAFSKQITTYGSDDAVEAYHKWNMATMNNAPVPIITRLMADFLLAVRRDLSYPDTEISGTTLIATTFRVRDFYQQGDEFRKIMTLPLSEACALVGWQQQWEFSKQPVVSYQPDTGQGNVLTTPAQGDSATTPSER
jgi:hypothetical protein